MGSDDIEVRPGLVIPRSEWSEHATRSSGPGGQNVNKVSSRVTLRWHFADSAALTAAQRARIREALPGRVTRDGELLVHAQRHRSRSRNAVLARERLAELVREALAPRRSRRPTRPTRASKQRTRSAKEHRAQLKRARAPVRPD